jgi:hypothetical protein
MQLYLSHYFGNSFSGLRTGILLPALTGIFPSTMSLGRHWGLSSLLSTGPELSFQWMKQPEREAGEAI